MSAPQFPGQKFVCKVEQTLYYEGNNGPTSDDTEETFESDTYDGLIEKLAEHRYGQDTWDLDHNNTINDRRYSYGPIMIVFSETPLDIEELRATKHAETFRQSLDKRAASPHCWMRKDILEQLRKK